MAVSPPVRVPVSLRVDAEEFGRLLAGAAEGAIALADVVDKAQRWREAADHVPLVVLTPEERDLLAAVDRYNEAFARFAEPIIDKGAT